MGVPEERGLRASPALPGVTGAIPPGNTAGRKGMPAAVGDALSQPQAKPRMCPRERQGGGDRVTGTARSPLGDRLGLGAPAVLTREPESIQVPNIKVGGGVGGNKGMPQMLCGHK